jgi:glutathione peroxidase
VVYQELTQLADGEGQAGDVQWNFEKFLVAGGKPVRRIRPMTDPESAEVVEAIEAALG